MIRIPPYFSLVWMQVQISICDKDVEKGHEKHASGATLQDPGFAIYVYIRYASLLYHFWKRDTREA